MPADRYHHRPTEVEAMLLTESNLDEVAEWCKGRRVNQSGSYRDYIVFEIPNLGTRSVHVGEWLVLDGTFQSWHAEDFTANYYRTEVPDGR